MLHDDIEETTTIDAKLARVNSRLRELRTTRRKLAHRLAQIDRLANEWGAIAALLVQAGERERRAESEELRVRRDANLERQLFDFADCEIPTQPSRLTGRGETSVRLGR